MALSNFGERFAAKTIRRVWQNAVSPAITNENYQGEIKQAGDRVNLLSLPGDFRAEDYVAGTDMSTFAVYDMEEQLVIEKRKAHNFAIDRLEDLFTYADDLVDNLTENVAKSIERMIDTYVLEHVQYAKAGSWVGIDLRVTGSSRDTEASIATTATGGTISVDVGSVNGDGTVEHGDGTLDYGGFTTADIGKPIRLLSGSTWATEWYRITAVTDSVTISVENWDAAAAAHDIPNGDILRGMYGASEFTGGATNGDGKPTTEGGWGWELQAGRATSVTASNVYECVTLLAEKLDKNEIPDTDRHLTVDPTFVTLLRQASELQPAIAMAYENVILNGKVGRIGGFDVHVATGARVTSRLAHSTSTGQGADAAPVDGTRATQYLANHISFCTFAYKWAESRVVDAENQFAKKYQALHLWGARVPNILRRSGANLFGTV